MATTPEWERDAIEYEDGWYNVLSDEEKEQLQAEADEHFAKVVMENDYLPNYPQPEEEEVQVEEVDFPW